MQPLDFEIESRLFLIVSLSFILGIAFSSTILSLSIFRVKTANFFNRRKIKRIDKHKSK